MINLADQWSHRIRSRVLVSHVLVVLVTTLLFALGMLLLKERLEAASWSNMLRSQLDAAFHAQNPDYFFDAPPLEDWSLFRAGALDMLPDDIQALEPGSHHSQHFMGRTWQVEVAIRNGEKMILAYDISDWEESEHQLLWGLGIGACLSVMLALLLGHFASPSIVRPVTRLSQRIDGINVETGLSEDSKPLLLSFNHSEMEPIARAVDTLFGRVDQLLLRERTFTGAVSHELRSSLAIMQGAIEVLQLKAGDEHTQQLDRMARSCADMVGFVEAALMLAREEALSDASDRPCDLKDLLDSLREEMQAAAAMKNAQLFIRATARPVLDAPCSLVRMAVSNLLRNAIEHSEASKIVVTIGANSLMIADNGRGIAQNLKGDLLKPAVSGERGRSGLGLSLVHRIVQRFGWQLDWRSEPDEGTVFTVNFSAATGQEEVGGSP